MYLTAVCFSCVFIDLIALALNQLYFSPWFCYQPQAYQLERFKLLVMFALGYSLGIQF